MKGEQTTASKRKNWAAFIWIRTFLSGKTGRQMVLFTQRVK